MLLVRTLVSSIFIAQGTVWGYSLLRRTDLDNKKAGEIPSSVLHSDSKVDCGILCAQEDTCAALTYHDGQCFLYNSSLSTSGLPSPGASGFISDVPAPDARTFIKRDHCPLSLGYTSVPSADLCFKYHDVSMNYTASQEQCESDGGRLVILNTVEKRDYIVATLGVKLIYPHIGLRRVGGLTSWLDGSTYLPGKVAINLNGCGILYHGAISTYYCNWLRPSFCEIPVNYSQVARPFC
ncbi:uncharacterized protein LOC124262618 [Haliotis rubra]|uniref:uncharacterized protein LOC124262618 n=1 Tax=Haliotis rubra TaxID=36100 RepID=UPI001EE5DC87|nr:uncharacterized protein LOC124262618 [Haliotis rubra]